jgi:hypothetical protein
MGVGACRRDVLTLFLSLEDWLAADVGTCPVLAVTANRPNSMVRRKLF